MFGLVLATFGFQTATSNRSQANTNQENKNTTKQPVGQMTTARRNARSDPPPHCLQVGTGVLDLRTNSRPILCPLPKIPPLGLRIPPGPPKKCCISFCFPPFAPPWAPKAVFDKFQKTNFSGPNSCRRLRLKKWILGLPKSRPKELIRCFYIIILMIPLGRPGPSGCLRASTWAISGCLWGPLWRPKTVPVTFGISTVFFHYLRCAPGPPYDRLRTTFRPPQMAKSIVLPSEK